MEEEVFDKIIGLVIETQNECMMHNDDNRMCWGNDRGVEDMSEKLQHKIWEFAVKYFKEGVA